MASIAFKDFDSWLQKYGAAWEKGDPDSAMTLFASDALYYETPFDDPMIGREAIYKYWREGAELDQEDIHFSYIILAVEGNVGLAHWRAQFKRLSSEKHVTLDGIFKVEFNDEGICEVFREWWHRTEKPQHE